MTEEEKEGIRREWLRVRPWIEAALEHTHGTHTIKDIEDGIVAGRYVVWSGPNCAAITEIHQFPHARFFHLFLGGGDLDEIKGLLPLWHAFAAHNGCTRMTLAGRRGWERAFKNLGWEADIVCLSTPVVQGVLQ